MRKGPSKIYICNGCEYLSVNGYEYGDKDCDTHCKKLDKWLGTINTYYNSEIRTPKNCPFVVKEK